VLLREVDTLLKTPPVPARNKRRQMDILLCRKAAGVVTMSQPVVIPETSAARRVIANLHELAADRHGPPAPSERLWPGLASSRQWFRGCEELGLSGRHRLPPATTGCICGTIRTFADRRSHSIRCRTAAGSTAAWAFSLAWKCCGILCKMVRRRSHSVGGLADEEGRFGHSLLGSSAAAGTLDLEQVRGLVDPKASGSPMPCARTASS